MGHQLAPPLRGAFLLPLPASRYNPVELGEVVLDRSPSVTNVATEAIGALLAAAEESRARAYAPYSGFHVGASVLTADGHTYCGSNVENASYGLTMCAERVAVFTAVAAGAKRVSALAVSAEPAAWPCGACRQVLAEFADPDCMVIVAEGGREVARVTVADLLPNAFSPVFRPRTQSG